MQDGVKGRGIGCGCDLIIKGKGRACLQRFHPAGYQTVPGYSGHDCKQYKDEHYDQDHIARAVLFPFGRCHKKILPQMFYSA
mgnify:CR=1 FL=1